MKRQRQFLIKDTLLNSQSGHRGGREFAPSHCSIAFLHDEAIYKEFEFVKYSAAVCCLKIGWENPITA